MKNFFAWLKKIVGIAAAVSTNPTTKAKLEIAEKVLEKTDDKADSAP